jgi:PLP dependent protein
VRLLAVTKTVPMERIRTAFEAGQRVFGENRVQEAEARIAALPDADWHLVGHLQSNKARRAVELFGTIGSVDSLPLARRLDGLAGQLGRPDLPVYLQVNVDDDPTKEGFDPDDLAADLDALAALERLRLEGLMTVGRLVSDPEQARPTFSRLRELSQRLRSRQPRLGAGLSMGMSDDYEVAVEEGATLVRVGRALFGERRPV